MNEENNNVVVEQPKKKNTTLLIIIILVLLIGGLCILFFATDLFKNKEKKESNENNVENTENIVLTPQEKKETYKTYAGKYSNGDSILKIFYIEQGEYSLVFYDITNKDNTIYFNGYVEVNQIMSGTIKDTILSKPLRIILKDGEVKIETELEEVKSGIYSKNGEYSDNDFFVDHYGSLDLLKTKYNGVYSLDDKTLTIYQDNENQISFVISKNGVSEFSSRLNLVDNTQDVVESVIFTQDEVDIIVKLTYTEGNVTFEINGDEYQQYVGTYKRERDVTPHDIFTQG